MEDIQLYGVAVMPLITGIIAIINGVFNLDKKYSPIMAVILGIGAGILLYPTEIPKAIVLGVSYGLGAVGVYSGAVKPFIKGE